MSNYTKLTDFASKDALPTGNAAKIVKGTEIDDEFEAIETAVATKADIASPTFTDVPTAPTAASATNTTQLATTAFVQAQKASPTFTGVPTAPTAAAGTNTLQLATTAHVFAERNNAVTLTNKTVNLTSNTLTGTTAQFNTALSDDDFATLTNTVTLTNKTLTSPTITGTPTAPTAAASTNTTQLATTAFVQQEINAIPGVNLSSVYPVGSVYINASVSTNPGTLLGFGTWAAFGAGRVMVGLDAGQAEFNTLGQTGGTKTHTLTVNEIPAHSHGVQVSDSAGSNQSVMFVSGNSGSAEFGSNTVARTINTTSSGSGSAHNNLQPYIVVYMWKRTA
jgi:hypothetical protein